MFICLPITIQTSYQFGGSPHQGAGSQPENEMCWTGYGSGAGSMDLETAPFLPNWLTVNTFNFINNTPPVIYENSIFQGFGASLDWEATGDGVMTASCITTNTDPGTSSDIGLQSVPASTSGLSVGGYGQKFGIDWIYMLNAANISSDITGIRATFNGTTGSINVYGGYLTLFYSNN